MFEEFWRIRRILRWMALGLILFWIIVLGIHSLISSLRHL